jgi:hypothetical protein
MYYFVCFRHKFIFYIAVINIYMSATISSIAIIRYADAWLIINMGL